MRQHQHIHRKIYELPELQREIHRWRLLGKTCVFTNGCFDILHPGHLSLLEQAAAFGDGLVVAINSDRSVQGLKGPHRPVNPDSFRAALLASLVLVDAVIIFEEPTPLSLIQALQPDVLVKGGDYRPESIVGAEDVIKSGGRVEVIPYVKGFSTTGLIEKIQSL